MNVQAWVAEAKRMPRAKRRAVLRPIGATVAYQTALRAVMLRIIREARGYVASDVLPAAISARAQLQRKDLGWFQRAMRTFRDLLAGFVDGAREEIRRATETEEQRHRRRFHEAVRSAIGIDLAAAIISEGIEAQVAAAVQRNVALIRGLSEDMARRVELVLIGAITDGASNALIAKLLTREFGFSTRRAAFIARDQAASFNGDLNRIRQTRLGITEYQWSTSRDERVRGRPDGKYPNARPSHWAREGETFRWDKPPSDGHPGAAINCRCVALAIIEF